jgi:transcriptional regulator with XRE-family HTH domain
LFDRPVKAADRLEEIKHDFSARLSAQIKKKKLTISGLASISGISRSVLSGYLCSDPALPNVFNLIRLADALGCDPGVLLLQSTPQNMRNTGIFETSDAMTLGENMSELLEQVSSARDKFIY